MTRNAALVISLLVFQAMLAVVVVAKPESLGIHPVVLNWLAILNVGIGALLNQLKALGNNHQN